MNARSLLPLAVLFLLASACGTPRTGKEVNSVIDHAMDLYMARIDNEDPLDAPPSVGSADIPVTSTPSTRKVGNHDGALPFQFIISSFIFSGKGPLQEERDPVHPLL